MSTNSKTPRFAALLALLAVLCFALGASDAIAKSKSKSKSTVEDAAVLTFDKSTRDGGIDPTTVPIIDEDMQFMVQVTRAQIGADAAHTITRGEGMVVAVLDSGFNLDHPALAGRLMGRGYDAIDDDFDAHDTGNGFDDNFDGLIDSGVGHGTFVAGMVLLAAPDAMILPIRVRDDEGYGTNAETIRGLKFAKSIGVDVINLSLSSASYKSSAVRKDVDALRADGVSVVVSAGNDGVDASWLGDLAISTDCIAVGAVDAQDVLAPFSNYAMWSEIIYAPGVDLYGPTGAPVDDAYASWSGTSFSAGLVSGAVALVRGQQPFLSPGGVRAHLQATSDVAWSAYGYPLAHGRINLWKAVTQ